jgi:Xaa-Pro aminopeptidase
MSDGLLLNIARARALMERSGLDGIVAASLENNLYLSGIWHRGQEYLRDYRGFTVARRERPEAGVVVVSTGSAELALQAYPSIERIVTFGTFYRDISEGAALTPEQERVKRIAIDSAPKDGPVDALVAALSELELERARVGVDERGGQVDLLDQLRERLPHMTIVPAAQLFREIRMVKTPEEVERLTATLRITERAVRAVFSEAREGISERDLCRVFEQTVVAGGGRPAFTLIRFGTDAALAGIPVGDTRLRGGDSVLMDVGCTFRGYRSDIGRAFTFGEPSNKYRQTYEAIKGGQGHAISMLRPGARAGDVFRSTVQRVRELGIPHYRRHHVGHAIGLEFYDMPTLEERSDVELEAGMVFEVETPYYELGFGAAFIEDTVLIEQSGPHRLTELDRDLLVIPAESGTKMPFSEATHVGGGGTT